ncbi:MAG: CoB--CoM heterodisulfide reductase iron-sulfur subunit B family protein [Acidihalobacter sp.]
MGKVAYYPGCALEGSGGPYDKSTRVLVKALGLEMENIRDYNCCGAMEVKNIHPMLQTYLSSRVMALASQEMGFDTVMAPCNGCYHNLKKAEYETATSEKAMQTVQDLAQKADDPVYQGDVRTLHLLEWLMEELGTEGIKQKMQTACCGGAHTLSDSDTSTQLVLNIIQAAEDAGAEIIATECPTCHSGLEMHQVRAETEFGIKSNVKVIYFTQLLGLALGLSPRKLGVHENISDSIGLLTEKGII